MGDSTHAPDAAEDHTLGTIRRLPAELVLAVHVVVAAFMLGLAPHGFSVTHPRFWTNTGVPAVALVASAVGLVILLGERSRWPAQVLVGLATTWLALAVGLRLVFPVTCATLWAGVLAFAMIVVASARVLGGGDRRLSATAAALGLLAGSTTVIGLRPPVPATKPLGGEVALTSDSDDPLPVDSALVDDRVLIRSGSFRAELRALLTFDITTADGGWSLFGKPRPPRRLIEGTASWARFNDGAALAITPSGSGREPVQASGREPVQASGREPVQAPGREPVQTSPTSLRFDAATPVGRLTHSHLNAFAELSVEGLAKPSVSFSPIGGQRFDVENSYTEGGAPARFAMLEPGGRFTVFRAASDEKGPFNREATGLLEPGTPLTMNFYDGGEWRLSLTLDDWSAQASVGTSPTSGLPQNAIEMASPPGGPLQVWVTLAATSVGRGWDTVGHQPGVYRNRGKVSWAPAGAARANAER